MQQHAVIVSGGDGLCACCGVCTDCQWHLFSYELGVRYAHKSKLPASYRLTACVCMREYLRAAKQESVASESQAHDALCSGHLLMKHTLSTTRRSQSSRRCCRDTSKGNGALLAKQGGNHQER